MRIRAAGVSVLLALVVGTGIPVRAATVPGKLASRIKTSEFPHASPDPSGIVYLRGRHRFLISDSEVEERTGAGHRRVNLWNIWPSGSVVSERTTRRFSDEPTGLGLDPTTKRLFVSDDDANRIFIDRPGRDREWGTADDRVRAISVVASGSADAEDPSFDRASGHLFFLDGDRTAVYRINPVDRVFGNRNDRVSHFDIGHLGPTNFEAMASDPSRDTLLLGGVDERIYETTKRGRLVRVIDVSAIRGLRRISGIALAPASDGSGETNYWIVDRGIDNDSHRNENDGDIWEISVGP